MSNTILPTTAKDHAAAARWSTAWTLVRDVVPELLRAGSLDELLWLHELTLRLGLDVRRRWIGRLLRQRHPESARVLAVTMLDRLRRGQLVDAFQLAQQPWPEHASPADRVPWLLAKARVAHELRDHDTAQALLDEAETLHPDEPTVLVERLWALESKDQLADAIALCAVGRQRFPTYGNLVAVECWLRHDANTPGLAAFLTAAQTQIESPFLDSILANLAYENGDLAKARQRWAALLQQPWHERRMRVGWHFALLRVCRELGENEAALDHALAAGPAGAMAAERLRTLLAQPSQPLRTRVVLPVPFVRQDHQTCSPATMASLLSFFDVAADQRDIAGQITWDGTASHDELRWARSRGLSIRFFAWDATVARDLIARGLPFAISTRFETTGHRQAVVGYDTVLDTFVLRDPTGHYRREVHAQWLETLMQRGGDCALLLPTDVATAAAVPPLPAESETMEWLELRLDLDARRMAGTAERTASLLTRTAGPLHFDIETRTLQERGERARRLEAYVQAHERAPDDAYWQYRLAGELLDQDRWQDARAFLERVAECSSSPFLWRLLAEQWSHDARRRPEALALMHRALRRLGRDARSWLRLACMLWDDGRKHEATAFYRIAAMLAPMDEWLAGSYFRALRGTGRSDQGLAFLQQRATQALGKSAAPAGTLADALESLHRPNEAIAVLRTALASDDTPEQRDRLCRLLLRHHRHDEAATLLADRDRFEPVDHALRSHQLAVARNDRAGTRTALQAAVAAMPTHTDAQRSLLDDLLAVEGLAAALARADQLVAEHADHPALLAEVADFFRCVDDHARVDALLQRLVQEHPDQHWLRGRLARHWIARGRFDAAAPLLAELQLATPRSSAVQLDIANHARATDQLHVAREAARTALQLAPDNTGALHLLLNLARDHDEAIAALRLAMQLLLERPQPPQKAELTGLVGLVSPLPEGEFDAFLQRLEANFPAESAIAVTRCEYLLGDDPTTALPIAEALVQQEAWRTDHHLLLARCLHACNRRTDQRAALEALLRVDPTCTQAFVEIGESFDQEGRLPQAMATFERGLAVAPGYAVLHGMLADAAWRLGERDRALLAVQRAADLDPGYAWAFSARIDWLCELGRIAEATAIASDLARDNPMWATAHDLHARALANAGRHQESITALQQALALSPRLGTTRLALLDALVALKRFDEARRCVAEGLQLLGDHPPLRFRECALTRAQGQLQESRQQLRELLQHHADYEYGWRRLLGWLDEEGLFDEILALYREPPEALRNDHILRGYAGDVLQQRGDATGAVAAFEQALAINQGYQWARDQLCELLLRQRQFQRVLDLLPDHAEPERLPWFHAVLVGKAFAHSGRIALARAALVRLMRDASWRGMQAADLDDLLRLKDPVGHERFLQSTLDANHQDTTFFLHWLRMLGRRQQWRRFWHGIDAVHQALGRTGDLLPVVAAIVDVSRDRQVPGLVRWARRHLRPPIEDIRVVGQLMYLLCDDAREQRQLVRLLADGWRRPDVEGWMLANMSAAFVGLGRLDEAEQVLQFALESVPQDHSVWWFHRDRAEIALRQGDWAACSAAYREPPADYPTVRLSAWQIHVCAELRQLPWWRRGSVLRRRLRRSFELRDLSLREPRASGNLRVRDLWCACPGLTTGLLCCGKGGRWLVRRLLRA